MWGDPPRAEQALEKARPMTQPNAYFAQLAQNVQAVMQNQNGMSAALRKMQEEHARFSGIEDVLKGLNVSKMGGDGGGGGRANGPMSMNRRTNSLISIDEIPGRCYPYEATCDIAIDSNSTSQQQATISINMDGPFVAVGRYAVFRSNYTFMVEGADATYLGRSNGRFRPISSAQDTADALRAFDQVNQYQQPYVGAVITAGGTIYPVANPAGIHPTTGAQTGTTDQTNMLPNFPGTGRPLVASPFNQSPYRTMSFDGLIAYETLGSQFRRQWNQQGIPSHFWDTVKEMGCFDVFEPNDVVQIRATPLHPMNPEYGNIQGLGAINADYGYDSATGGGVNDPFPVGNWPWISSQYDGHEGINGETLAGDNSASATDRITRLPNGVLTIGFWGYKIVQAPGIAV